MLVSSGKLIGSMVYSIVLLVSKIHESIIRWPTITIYLCIFNLCLSCDDRNKGLCLYIRHYLGIYFSISFEESEYYCLHSSSSSSLSSDSGRSEITLIYLHCPRPYFCFLGFLILEYTLTDIEIPIIYSFWI